MPTYEFRCPAGHDVERFFKISEAPSEVECPTCGQTAARRISGGAGLVFKGSGFYITDYGKDGKKDQRKAPAAGASGGSDKSAGEASKPAGGDAPKKADTAAPAATTPAKASE